MKNILKTLTFVSTAICLSLIRAYQKCISPLLGPRCRFYPSCSQYAALAIERYGLKQGIWKSFRRICKCHPWNSGGVDFP